jgi:hypothetical protein
LSWLDASWKTFGWWGLRRGGFDKAFHTYTLEWDQDFMYVLFHYCHFSTLTFFNSRIFVDTRLHHVLDLRFKKPFFELGDFPGVVQNATDTIILENPWINGTIAAPFDQRMVSLRMVSSSFGY